MLGVRIHTRRKLSRLLEPLNSALDRCWWYLNGKGVSLGPPSPVATPELPADQSPVGWAKWRAENVDWVSACHGQRDAYDEWVNADASYRVGLPGWFSRYIDCAEMDWAIYYACDGADSLPRVTLDWIAAFHATGVDWFGDPRDWSLPTGVAAIIRDIDNAYWDIFFRDNSWLIAFRNHLRTFNDVLYEDFQVEGPGGNNIVA